MECALTCMEKGSSPRVPEKESPTLEKPGQLWDRHESQTELYGKPRNAGKDATLVEMVRGALGWGAGRGIGRAGVGTLGSKQRSAGLHMAPDCVI